MHFKTMVAVNIAPIVEDEKRNQEIRDMIQKLSDSRSEKVNHMLEWQISRLRSKVTGFSSAVDDMVSEVMEPYFQDTRNPDYLEFFDMTAELREDYNSTTDCIKLPEGKIVQLDRPPYYTNYIIQDGKVFQQQAGKLHHQKRTKKAKKIQALPQYPISSLYSSFEQYAESFGFEYDGKKQGYGYYCNPNTRWDWYQIGGRWAEMFLVRTDCKEYSEGERSWCNEDAQLEAPEGYIWVSAARKKDIDWDAMRKWDHQKSVKAYEKYKSMFLDGKLEEGFYGQIVEDGIIFVDKYLYHKGETLENFLERFAVPDTRKYPLGVNDIVDADNWWEQDDLSCALSDNRNSDWHTSIDEYIDNVDDDMVLVGVDYHI